MPSESQNEQVNMAVMATDIKYIKTAIEKIDDRLEVMDTHYIRRDEVVTMEKNNKDAHEGFEFQLREQSLDIGTFKTYVKIGTAVIAAIWAITLIYINKHL